MKPDERNKIIALVAGIVVVFGVGGFNIVRLMGGGGSPEPSPTPPATPDMPLTITPSPPIENGSPSPFLPSPGMVAQSGQEVMPSPGARSMEFTQEPSPLPVNAANPFRPISAGPPSVAAPTPAPNRASYPSASYAPPMRREEAPAASRMSVAPRGQDSAPPAPVISAKAPPRVSPTRKLRDYLAAIPLELVGVVENGSGSCALIKLGDEQVLVGPGERVSEFRVEKIELDSVTLVHSKLRRTLRVGADGTSSSSMIEPEVKQSALLLPVMGTVKRSSLFKQSPDAICPAIPDAPERLEPFGGQP